MSTKPHVIILGAGIIGLQTAYHLLQSGFNVSIVAKYWPGDKNIDYTSPWSGAQWRANLRVSDTKMQDWDRETFKFWMEYAAQYPAVESGLELKSAFLYWDHTTEDASDPKKTIWWSSVVPSFELLEHAALPPGISAGISYKTFSIAPTKYLRHLFFLCLQMGAKPYIAEVQTVRDVFDITSIAPAVGIVNCTGLSARTVANDETMFPTKGQTITVKGEASHIRTRIGGKWEAWVIPHPGTGTSLIGGCKLANDWSTNIDDKITEWILAQCLPLAPDLLKADGKFDVISVQIGRRPSREGGPRVELEWISTTDGTKRFVCHNYGHSHSGFENSVGSAKAAAKLIIDAVKGS